MSETAILHRWAKFETHCVLCTRRFAGPTEEERHAERECDEPCWCWEFCWVNQGGDCPGDPDLDISDDIGLWHRVRAAEEERDALVSILHQWHGQFVKRGMRQRTWGDVEVAVMHRHHDAIFGAEDGSTSDGAT